jgi:uncharacterized membrane protein
MCSGQTPVMTRSTTTERRARPTAPRAILEVVLGVALAAAGVAHLTTAREEFRAQVPGWFPVDEDLVVVVSGVVEIILGVALVAVLVPALARWRVAVGLAVAAFFVVIFPGNVAQFTEQRDAFGLDSDTARAVRLLFQPLLVAAALWSTDSWSPLVAAVRVRWSR